MQKQIFYIVLVFSICLEFVSSERNDTTQEQDLEGDEMGSKDEAKLLAEHTFVTLIDVVYTDGSKRSCTGAIIDDNVVITAAHCFLNENKPEIQPELTASFVVIGTKNMFDTGYEQYLPIERIVTHPLFDGWTADVSLVYTFAAMTADKPGTVIALADEKLTNQVDSNATVLTWGSRDTNKKSSTKAIKGNKHEKGECDTSGEMKNEASNENIGRNARQVVGGRLYKKVNEASTENVGRNARQIVGGRLYKKSRQFSNEIRQRQDDTESLVTMRTQTEVSTTTRNTRPQSTERTVKTPEIGRSRYMASNLDDKKLDYLYMRATQPKSTSSSAKDSLDKYLEAIWNEFAKMESKPRATAARNFKDRTYYKNRKRYEPQRTSTAEHRPTEAQEETETAKDAPDFTETETAKDAPDFKESNFKTYKHYKQWRRQMNTQQNTLSVEEFTFVNKQTCKNLIEQGVATNNNDSEDKNFLCYTSETYSITDSDSGAPIVKGGRLVAMTVGGVEFNGEYVGIGLKVACFCPWIANNVPNGKNITCDSNCSCGKRLQKAEVKKGGKPNTYIVI